MRSAISASSPSRMSTYIRPPCSDGSAIASTSIRVMSSSTKSATASACSSMSMSSSRRSAMVVPPPTSPLLLGPKLVPRLRAFGRLAGLAVGGSVGLRLVILGLRLVVRGGQRLVCVRQLGVLALWRRLRLVRLRGLRLLHLRGLRLLLRVRLAWLLRLLPLCLRLALNGLAILDGRPLLLDFILLQLCALRLLADPRHDALLLRAALF